MFSVTTAFAMNQCEQVVNTWTPCFRTAQFKHGPMIKKQMHALLPLCTCAKQYVDVYSYGVDEYLRFIIVQLWRKYVKCEYTSNESIVQPKYVNVYTLPTL